ncbi:hypothetical protein QVD17_02331 [Tagetes erecta]|uniref:Uncharacterized protein n=1 Tax=Tagetes erecta TaxID=13708 RepID=A0AAD8L6E5_TARER|nr:hypothetical protein QVD17_02331 [Tagetes erecta]
MTLNLAGKCSFVLTAETYFESKILFILGISFNGKTDKNNTGPSLGTKRSPDHFLEKATEMDCILMGDYLELNDLVDPVSCSSSSTSVSSCLTMTSEECFDSMDLLQALEDDNSIIDQEMKHSGFKFNVSAPVMSKEVVLHTSTSVSLRNNKERKPSVEETVKPENRIGSASNGVNTTSSSSSSKIRTKEGDNEHVSWTKRRKMIKYLCVLAF